MRKLRAPTALAPAVSWSSGPPMSGRRAASRRDGVAEAFELALADVFELDTVGTGGGGSVEVDGYAVAAPDEEAGLAGEHGALGEGGAADGDEGDDVGGSDAGMDAVLPGEVDELGGLACGADRGLDDCRRECRRW